VSAGFQGNEGNTIPGIGTIHHSEVRAVDEKALAGLAADGGNYFLHMKDHDRIAKLVFGSTGQAILSDIAATQV